MEEYRKTDGRSRAVSAAVPDTARPRPTLPDSV